MTEPELKPCPCCGATAVQRENKKGTLICIECENPICGLRTGWFLTYAEAAKAWNLRVPLNLAGIPLTIKWDDKVIASTHYEGCEAVHPACKIARLERENAELRRKVATLLEELAFKSLKGEK